MFQLWLVIFLPFYRVIWLFKVTLCSIVCPLPSFVLGLHLLRLLVFFFSFYKFHLAWTLWCQAFFFFVFFHQERTFYALAFSSLLWKIFTFIPWDTAAASHRYIGLCRRYAHFTPIFIVSSFNDKCNNRTMYNRMMYININIIQVLGCWMGNKMGNTPNTFAFYLDLSISRCSALCLSIHFYSAN